jgi:thiol:disulfide interchange protein
MVPILSGIIVGQERQAHHAAGFLALLVYVLAMAATYTVAGVLTGLFGQNLRAVPEPVDHQRFVLVFVLALSMFGFYELQLPGGCRPAWPRPAIASTAANSGACGAWAPVGADRRTVRRAALMAR